MKIVLWIGKDANQKALANKIHAIYPLSGIVIEERKSKVKITAKKIFEKGIEKIFLSSIAKSWFGMLNYYERKYPAYPETAILKTENINSDEAFQFTSELMPDLVVVSGTRLIKKKLLSIKPSIGIINLHTGLSPYIKGGPNCTNWCIATEQFHLIGNTVMWIDAGIDTGNIIATEHTAFDGDESLPGVHIKVMEHAHSLYLGCIKKLVSGERPNIAQDQISQGVTYYNKEWGLKEKFMLLVNFKKFKSIINSDDHKKRKAEIKTVGIIYKN